MELTDSRKALCIETAQSLQGSARRLCMARTVKARGAGGQRRAERELRWGRMTMRNGPHALESGCTCLDAFAARGRKRIAASLPPLWPDIHAMVESQSQADPQCHTPRLSTRLSAAEGRRQLIAQKGSAADALPPGHTITTKLHALGDYPQTVAKSPPQKKSQNPTPSSSRETGASRLRMSRTPSYASLGMPKPLSQWVPSREAAQVVPGAPPSSTIVSQRQRALPSASSCRRLMHSWCMG
jgi:hypothetical protein